MLEKVDEFIITPENDTGVTHPVPTDRLIPNHHAVLMVFPENESDSATVASGSWCSFCGCIFTQSLIQLLNVFELITRFDVGVTTDIPSD